MMGGDAIGYAVEHASSACREIATHAELMRGVTINTECPFNRGLSWLINSHGGQELMPTVDSLVGVLINLSH